MSSEIIKLIENQKKIPIIGKGTSIDIKNKFNRLVLDKYSVIEIALRSEDNIDVLENNFPFNYEIISGDKLNLSSTTLRNKLKEKNIEVSDLPSGILTYIKENSLY